MVERRSRHHLRQAEERLHLLEGFLIAMKSIGEVVKLIRSAREAQEAKKLLISTFELSATQAEGILALPLRRLTSFEASKLETVSTTNGGKFLYLFSSGIIARLSKYTMVTRVFRYSSGTRNNKSSSLNAPD